MAAVVVMALVIEAMAKMESGFTSTPEAESRLPKAPVYVILSGVATMATTAGIFLRVMLSRIVASKFGAARLVAANARFDCVARTRARAPKSLLLMEVIGFMHLIAAAGWWIDVISVRICRLAYFW